MRPLASLLLFASLAFAGCVDLAAPAQDSADTVEPLATAAAPSEPYELGRTGFSLGPMGNTPVSAVSAFVPLEVPENVRLIVLLAIETGVTVNFALEGLEGCEHRLDGPHHVSGMERSFECAPPPGAYELRASHTSGHVVGTMSVLAVPLAKSSAP